MDWIKEGGRRCQVLSWFWFSKDRTFFFMVIWSSEPLRLIALIFSVITGELAAQEHIIILSLFFKTEAHNWRVKRQRRKWAGRDQVGDGMGGRESPRRRQGRQRDWRSGFRDHYRRKERLGMGDSELEGSWDISLKIFSQPSPVLSM